MAQKIAVIINSHAGRLLSVKLLSLVNLVKSSSPVKSIPRWWRTSFVWQQPYTKWSVVSLVWQPKGHLIHYPLQSAVSLFKLQEFRKFIRATNSRAARLDVRCLIGATHCRDGSRGDEWGRDPPGNLVLPVTAISDRIKSAFKGRRPNPCNWKPVIGEKAT